MLRLLLRIAGLQLLSFDQRYIEVVAEEVERRAAGCFGVCRADSQRAKIESVHISVWEAPLYSQGFPPLMAATISFTVAVIEFY